MTPKTHAKRPATILLPLFLLIFSMLLTSCSEYWKDYREDVVVKDNFSDYRLIFREWSVLGGGGAKIYCRKGNGREKQLGEVSFRSLTEIIPLNGAATRSASDFSPEEAARPMTPIHGKPSAMTFRKQHEE